VAVAISYNQMDKRRQGSLFRSLEGQIGQKPEEQVCPHGDSPLKWSSETPIAEDGIMQYKMLLYRPRSPPVKIGDVTRSNALFAITMPIRINVSPI
jgi:hypothetical protein